MSRPFSWRCTPLAPTLTKGLQIANRETGNPGFAWTFASGGGGVIESSDGFKVDTQSVQELGECDIVIVVARAFRIFARASVRALSR